MADTADKRLFELYPAHFDLIRRRFEKALRECGFDAIVIGAGVEVMRFLDDQAHPFIPNPHLVQWLPLLAHPQSCLVFVPGDRPRLLIFRPDDYWHKPPPLPGVPWANHFDIEIATTTDQIGTVLNALPEHTAFLGDPEQWNHSPGDTNNNPGQLLNHLHFFRPFKTDYEIECIRAATQLAVPAHRAAERSFRCGQSEYDIWLAFLTACRQTAAELPYPAIIAKNRNGAVLHYQNYDRDDARSDSLLIDAACAACGYASDITRTYSTDERFSRMIDDLDREQQLMVSEASAEKPFAELHAFAHRRIAQLLSDWGLVAGNPEHFVERGITTAFFPHGLGHFLGIQVHEVGGSFADTAGTEIQRPAEYPHLRLVRTLEAGQVLTIEPGVYFIDSLLEKLRTSDAGADVDWRQVESLKKFGGIRIEDNIVIRDNGPENLTRAAFADSSTQ
ncbi:MAG: Xaa-Pro dipeptidase [Gammaproteobacteria bacterium]